MLQASVLFLNTKKNVNIILKIKVLHKIFRILH